MTTAVYTSRRRPISARPAVMIVVLAVLAAYAGFPKLYGAGAVPKTASAKRALRPAAVSAPTKKRRQAKAWSIRKRQMIAFYERAIVGGYEKFGDHNPKWDKPALALLKLVARKWAVYSGINPEVYYRVIRLANRAIKPGCNDPLVYYERGLAEQLVWRQGRLYVSDLQHGWALESSHYAPFLKEFDTIRQVSMFWDYKHHPDYVPARKYFLKKFLAGYPSLLKEKGLPAADILLLSSRYMRRYHHTYPGPDTRKVAYRQLEQIVRKIRPGGSLRWDMKGRFYMQYAWDARGDGLANSVSRHAWKLFAQRLAIASASLKRAMRLDAQDYIAPTAMIQVAMGQGATPAIMEKWFHRAVGIDPDDQPAYSSKKLFLCRRWGGSEAQLLHFAGQCMKSPRYDARIPFMAERILRYVAGYYGNVSAVSGSPVFAQNKKLWPVFEKLYLPYLRRHPHDYYDRWNFARMAAWCGHWRVAAAQLKIAGPHPRAAVFIAYSGNKKQLREFVALVNAHKTHP